MAKNNAPESAEVSQLEVQSPGAIIENPWLLARYMIQRAISQHRELTGRSPKLMYLPPLLEASLQIDLGRACDSHQAVRKNVRMFGIPVVWDAREFRLE